MKARARNLRPPPMKRKVRYISHLSGGPDF
jgi:hypothetical protein